MAKLLRSSCTIKFFFNGEASTLYKFISSLIIHPHRRFYYQYLELLQVDYGSDEDDESDESDEVEDLSGHPEEEPLDKNKKTRKVYACSCGEAERS